MTWLYGTLRHAGWLGTLALFVPPAAAPHRPLLALLGAAQFLRLRIAASLDRFCTTRILTLRGVPLVTKVPYRWLRHPNDLVLGAEIVRLPLAFGAAAIAAAFSVLDLALIGRRRRIEERALVRRREP